ncbi:hopanoid biosynthesis-associated protein HpnK [Methylobacterium sp. Leaf112]|jgi:hopanoid biosynthesis associated protein HpnK|uniref:hopanoid biosynthesis-associated protein HpnK n=1 Tax=Methylobacterium sp. Leaf112 TaxID=1736258 RepID=UPI0006F9885F|nr:hopanoid biosynthesis-associated protein HpnK [Methylobacterium sp. Leaf112]KQP59579.1 PTS cellobiose transporter [Methylobacterium sp. Leaf112]
MAGPYKKRLIVTADDFGLSLAVNEAVEQAHREGILTAASLMVGAPAAADAVARARRLPTLRIGLHLVMVEAWPTLPPADLPDLVGPDGLIRSDMGRLGLDLALKASARKQLAAEITAQFEAYQATGLPLDHVNAHKHFHVHPLIAGAVLSIGRRCGMRAVRVPREPRAVLRAAEPGAAPKPALDSAPWAALLAVRARQAGLLIPDRTLGLAWSGAMTPARVSALLAHLPDGLTELYTHPATGGGFSGEAPGYAYAAELDALTAPASRAALTASGAILGGFSDFAA